MLLNNGAQKETKLRDFARTFAAILLNEYYFVL
jgi:hypothetical protein